MTRDWEGSRAGCHRRLQPMRKSVGLLQRSRPVQRFIRSGPRVCIDNSFSLPETSAQLQSAVGVHGVCCSREIDAASSRNLGDIRVASGARCGQRRGGNAYVGHRLSERQAFDQRWSVTTSASSDRAADIASERPLRIA